MLNRLFDSIYGARYDAASPPGKLFLLPLSCIALFVLVACLLAFSRTVKTYEVDAEIVPQKTYAARLEARGFLADRHIAIGQQVVQGDVLAVVRTDDGRVVNVVAPHDGLVVDSDLRSDTKGPIAEGALVAMIVDGSDLVLRVPIPPQLRGAILVDSPVRYRFDTFMVTTQSRVASFQIDLAHAGQIQYDAIVLLDETHRATRNLGKHVQARIMSRPLSVVDYLLVD